VISDTDIFRVVSPAIDERGKDATLCGRIGRMSCASKTTLPQSVWHRILNEHHDFEQHTQCLPGMCGWLDASRRAASWVVGLQPASDAL